MVQYELLIKCFLESGLCLIILDLFIGGLDGPPLCLRNIAEHVGRKLHLLLATVHWKTF